MEFTEEQKELMAICIECVDKLEDYWDVLFPQWINFDELQVLATPEPSAEKQIRKMDLYKSLSPDSKWALNNIILNPSAQTLNELRNTYNSKGNKAPKTKGMEVLFEKDRLIKFLGKKFNDKSKGRQIFMELRDFAETY